MTRFRMAAAQTLMIGAVIASGLSLPHLSIARAEEGTEQALVIERFLAVLLRRPSAGTALDRVYQFHVDQASMDDLLSKLDVSQEVEGAGAKQMVRGLLFARRGDISASVEALEKAEQWREADAAASFHLAESLRLAGRVDEALRAYARSIDRGPDRQLAAEVYLTYGKLLAQTGKPDQAVAIFEQLSKRYSGNATVEEQVASVLAEQGQYEQARQSYRRLLDRARSDDKRFEYELKLADLDLQSGEVTAARDRLKRMLVRIRPESWLYENVRNRFEQTFFDSGQTDELISYYKAFVKEQPGVLESRLRLAELLADGGDLERAEQVYRESLTAFPARDSIRVALVRLLVRATHWSDAADELEELVERQPENPDFLMQLGDVHAANTSLSVEMRKTNASGVWKRLAKQREDDPVILATLAKRLDAIGKAEEASAMYRLAVDAKPEDPQYREWLGDHLHRQGKLEAAIRAWESMAEPPHRSAETLVRLAQILDRSGWPERALAVWKEASRLDLGIAFRLQLVDRLIDAKQFGESEEQLKLAASVVESPEEEEQLLEKRIEWFVASGKLYSEIERVSALPEDGENQRWLARLYQADGQTAAAVLRIREAMRLSPESIPVMVDAARIYQGMGETQAAIRLIDRVARLDVRRRTRHLTLLVQLCRRSKNKELALDAAKRLVESNPASAESLRIYAEVALESGDEKAAESSLRRAIQVAPRDMGLRESLASQLSKRFKTEEAVELYWQVLMTLDDPVESANLVEKLVPLYERRGQFDDLIRRIESVMVAGWGNPRRAALKARAWAAAGNESRGRRVLEQSIESYPRSETLLDSLVTLCVELDDFRAAADYQERLLMLNDSSSGRKRLIELELKSGLLTPLEASLRELENTEDPKVMMAIVRRHADGDPVNAARLCGQVVQRHPELWDVKAVFMQLLLVGDGPDRLTNIREAGALAVELFELGLPMTEKAPAGMRSSSFTQMYWTGIRPSVSSVGSRSLSAKPVPMLGMVNRSGRLSSGPVPGAAQALRLMVGGAGGDPESQFAIRAAVSLSTFMRFREQRAKATRGGARLPRSVASRFGTSFLPPADYRQARWIAAIVRMMAHRELQVSRGWPQTFRESATQEFGAANNAEKEVTQLRETWILNDVINVLDATELPLPEAFAWRIAKLDPKGNQWQLRALLIKRAQQIVMAAEKNGEKEPDPLTQQQLRRLSGICQARLEFAGKPNRKIDEIVDDAFFRQSLIAESRLAGEDHPFEGEGWPGNRPVGLVETLLEVQSALDARNVRRADELAEELLQAARSDRGQFASLVPSIQFWFAPEEEVEKEYVDRHRSTLIETWIAYCSRVAATQTVAGSKRPRVNGSRVQVVVPIGLTKTSRPKYELFQLELPLSKGLMSDSLMRGLVALLPKRAVAHSGKSSLALAGDLGERLAEDCEGAGGMELRSRKVVAAFMAWWDKRPEDCLTQLTRLADQYPEDLELQVEVARLAVVNGRTREGLDRLDSIRVLDADSKAKVEIARLTIASSTNNRGLADETLERLLNESPILPNRDELAAVLSKLNLSGRYFEELKSRLKGGSRASRSFSNVQSETQRRLELANQMLDQGDRLTAAEVAYSVIGRLGAGPGADKTIREAAIQILVRAKSLGRLIESTERKLQSSAHPDEFRRQLSRLYLLNDQWEDAWKLWDQLISSQNLSPRQVVQRASSLRGRRQYEDCVMLYLRAFRADPDLWSSHWSVFADCVVMTNLSESVCREMQTFPLERMRAPALFMFVGKVAPVEFGEQQLKLVRQLISTYGSDPRYLDQLIDVIPQEHRMGVPEIRDAMAELAKSDEMFNPESPLWKSQDWDDSGAVRGVLDNVMRLLVENADVAAQFAEAAETAQEADASGRSRLAEMLTAQLDLFDASTRSRGLESIRKNLESIKLDPREGEFTSSVPPSLLWQMGQLIPAIEGIENPLDVQLTLFEAASRFERAVPDSEGRHPTDQLLRLYATRGRIGLARERWMERLRTTELPGSTGVREDRRLRLVEHVANNLFEIGCYVDASSLCRQELSDTATLHLARPYSRGRNHEQQLRELAQRSFALINDSAALRYFVMLGEELQLHRRQQLNRGLDWGQGTPLLGLARVTELAHQSSDCVFEHAMLLAGRSADGRSKLKEILLQVQSWGTLGELPPERAVVRLTLESVLSPPDEIASSLETLLVGLPDPEELQQSPMEKDDPRYPDWKSSLLHRQSIATIRRNAGLETEDSIEHVIERLRKIAIAVEALQVERELVRLSRTQESMNQLLDLAETAGGSRAIGVDDWNDCMAVAGAAADREMWAVAGRALWLGLGNGLPKVRKSPDRSSESSASFPIKAKPDRSLLDDFQGVLEKVRDADGNPVNGYVFDPSAFSSKKTLMLPLEQALRDVVYPPDPAVNVFPYPSNLFGTVGRRKDWEPRSAAHALSNLARICQTQRSLVDLAERHVNANADLDSVGLLVIVSAGQGDRVRLANALEQLEKTVDGILPVLNSEAADNAVVTHVPPSNEQHVLSVSNQLLCVLWPLLSDPGLRPMDREKSARLLLRTAKLMLSQDTVAKNHAAEIARVQDRCRELVPKE